MKRYLPNTKVLTATVVRLGLVAFFADLSSEMLYPITPIFMTIILGASFTSIGLVEGVAEGLASILKIFSGHFADRFGHRKSLVGIGYFFSALGKPLIGLATGWPGVLLGRSVDRFGKGIRTAPRDALLAASVSPSEQGAAFGWHRAMDTMGAVLGPLAAIWFLHSRPDALRSAYFYAFIPGMIAVFFVMIVKDAGGVASKSQLRWNTILDARFKKYLFSWTVFSLANSSDVFLLLKCSKAGFSTTTVVLLYCLFNLSNAIASPVLGHLSDQIPRFRVLAGGLVAFSLVYLGFAFSTTLPEFVFLFAVYGLYTAATDGVGKAFAVDLLPPHARGTGLGWLGMLTGLATVVASTIAGGLWDRFGAEAPFLFGAIGASLAALLLLFFFRLDTRENVS